MINYDAKARRKRYLDNREHALSYRKQKYKDNREQEKADSLARYRANAEAINAKRRKKNKRKTT